ncbi:MAG: hypothetical protein GEU74_05000 [Nitriliruptorales bacterium]|nr:hypothetical protein [Nitriliruptorales bacterium]
MLRHRGQLTSLTNTKGAHPRTSTILKFQSTRLTRSSAATRTRTRSSPASTRHRRRSLATKMRMTLRSTSTRTFVLWPALVAAEQLLSGRALRPRWAPLLAWGYLQYRWSGAYRTRVGGGGPGMSRPPERVVTSGIYRWTRNPMYLGHQIFLAGVALATRSPLAVALFAVHVPWFDARARDDERALEAQFGATYDAYRRTVPRWLPVADIWRKNG